MAGTNFVALHILSRNYSNSIWKQQAKGFFDLAMCHCRFQFINFFINGIYNKIAITWVSNWIPLIGYLHHSNVNYVFTAVLKLIESATARSSDFKLLARSPPELYSTWSIFKLLILFISFVLSRIRVDTAHVRTMALVKLASPMKGLDVSVL